MWFWLRTSYKTQENRLGRKPVCNASEFPSSSQIYDIEDQKVDESLSLGRLRKRMKANGWQIGCLFCKIDKQAGSYRKRICRALRPNGLAVSRLFEVSACMPLLLRPLLNCLLINMWKLNFCPKYLSFNNYDNSFLSLVHVMLGWNACVIYTQSIFFLSTL